MQKKFEVGDKVKVIPDIRDCDFIFCEGMKDLWGTIATIKFVNNHIIQLYEDVHIYNWSSNQFTLISETTAKNTMEEVEVGKVYQIKPERMKKIGCGSLDGHPERTHVLIEDYTKGSSSISRYWAYEGNTPTGGTESHCGGCVKVSDLILSAKSNMARQLIELTEGQKDGGIAPVNVSLYEYGDIDSKLELTAQGKEDIFAWLYQENKVDFSEYISKKVAAIKLAQEKEKSK